MTPAASVAPYFTSLMYLIIGILGITFLIGFHELGHFTFAKLFRVRTPSFSIGFGPTLIKKKIGDTVFKVSAIPLGGYVEIAGMQEVAQGDQKEAQSKNQYSFAVKPYWQKLLILLGGIMFNLLFAYAAFILLFAVGMPKTAMLGPLYSTTTVESVHPESPAADIGLKKGDVITGIGSVALKGEGRALVAELARYKDGTVEITYERNGSLHTATVDYTKVPKEFKGRLGVGLAPKKLARRPFLKAITDGFRDTNQFIYATVKSYLSILRRCSTTGLGGPLMIISSMSQGARYGFKIWLFLLAIISINLAVLNLIPVPILDGGQLLFTTIEAIIRRPIPDSARMIIHYICWIAVLLLVIYLSCKDLKAIFKRKP